MEKNKIIFGLMLFFLLSLIIEDGSKIQPKKENINYPKTSSSDYFDWITPESENITISNFYNYTIEINDTSKSGNYQVKLWKKNPSNYNWYFLGETGHYNDNLTYTFDPINYENGNWNITVKCQIGIEMWDNDTKNIYILNERPEINVSNPNDSEIIMDFYNYRINGSVSDKEKNKYNVSIALFNSNGERKFGWRKMTNYAENNYEHYFDPIDYKNGDYIISIRANDSKGYGYTNISIIIQNNRPNITIHYPFDSQIIRDECMLNVSVRDEENDMINVSIGLFNISNDLILGWEEMNNYRDNLYNYTLDPSFLDNEIYTLRIKANDTKGYTYESIEITIDYGDEEQINEDSKDNNDKNKDDSEEGFWEGLITPAIISGVISGLVAIFIKAGYGFVEKRKEKIKNRLKSFQSDQENGKKERKDSNDWEWN